MDVNDNGVTGKNHGGPGWEDDEGFMPQNRRNTHLNVEDRLAEAEGRDPGSEMGTAGYTH
jgi:hypothetical protein